LSSLTSNGAGHLYLRAGPEIDTLHAGPSGASVLSADERTKRRNEPAERLTRRLGGKEPCAVYRMAAPDWITRAL